MRAAYYESFATAREVLRVGDLPLSLHSSGAGHVYARSDWSDEATYLLFKASDRFTAHQHLDVGHFSLYRGAELTGDGGHYDDFNSAHVIKLGGTETCWPVCSISTGSAKK